MNVFDPIRGCGTKSHFSRRTLLAAGAMGATWLTPLATALARSAEKSDEKKRPRSVIVLWLQGGPSQLETFDPHPGSDIAADSKARDTAVKGIQLGEGFEQVADLMQDISIVRSVMSKEGDHERATYNVKTGFRPDPTLVHPSIGSIICHELDDKNVEIPRHIAIMPAQMPPRGGYLGDQYDAFKTFDPIQPVPSITPRVAKERFNRRVDILENVIEAEFNQGPFRDLEDKTLHLSTVRAAARMMSSDQLKAFDVKQAPESLLAEYANTPFGRGCLAAARLIEVGVRCVEVTLNGWDTHANNHNLQADKIATLDPAFAALVRDLKRRDLFDSTIVLCGGEFGRTPGKPGKPGLNGTAGRDHWPHGFSIALAGGGLRGGVAVGETSPDPKMDKEKPKQDVKKPYAVEDIHATVLHKLGIDYESEHQTPVQRPMVFSEGRLIEELL